MYMRDAGLGGLLRSAMAGKRISMRELSRSSGIGVSTISRIVSGKQEPGIAHLKAFSRHLDIPLSSLLCMVGLSDGSEQEAGTAPPPQQNILLTLLETFDIDPYTLAEQVRNTLKTYREYAATAEGEQMIRRLFPDKIISVGGPGIAVETLNRYYERYCSCASNCEERLVLGSILLYFVLSTDAIPDYLFPFGYLDDALALYLVQTQLRDMEQNDR